MPNYLHTASGTLAGAFPWSFHWYSVSTATESAAETAWGGGIASMFSNVSFASMISTGVVLTQTSTSTMDAGWHQTTKTTTTHNTAGTATQALPHHISLVVTWLTNQANKTGRGRWYLPAPASASLATAGFTLSPTAQADLVGGINVFLTAVIGTINPVILHRKGNRSGTVGALTTTPIIAGNLGDGYDTQRRRADKRIETRVALTF
jgi:hypothetical protein